MINVLNTNHTKAYFDKEKQLMLIRRFLPEITSEEIYKKEALLWAEIYPQYKPLFQLVDMTENHYVVNSELQKWIEINVLSPAMKSGTKYVAFVVSKELFVKLSHEVIMEQVSASIFSIRYFDSEEKALEWLENTSKEI